jgi:Lrp/AsnC family leucine-responsive transcriptional regulator
MIDAIDRQILNILQSDGRASNAEIARQIGLAPSAVYERIRKLEQKGVVRGYTATVDPTAVGLGLLAFVFVRSSDRLGTDDVAKALAAAPEVLEVHSVAGEDCFLVKVRAADTRDLHLILQKRFGAIKDIRSTRTVIALDSVKETTVLPIPEPADDELETADA